MAWDEAHWLYLLNRKGERQAQRRSPGNLAVACCADDGSAYAAVGTGGEIWWLTPDLTPRWEAKVPHPATAAALDPFGQYLAVATERGNLHVFNRLGEPVCQTVNPRPLLHLAFVPAAPVLVGCAEYGLVAAFDLTGRQVWRDGLVANVGALAVSGGGYPIVLACFSEGLQRYGVDGRKQERLPLDESCRRVALSFDGHLLLAAGTSNRLLLADGVGKTLATYAPEGQVVAVVLSCPMGDHAGWWPSPIGRVLGPDLNRIGSWA